MKKEKEGNIHPKGLSSWAGAQKVCVYAGEGDSQYDWKNYRHRMTLWLHNHRNPLCGLETVTVVRCALDREMEREKGGKEIRRRRCWDFHLPPSSTFITNPSRAKWMLRHSKLTLRVTEAAPAVCGITFHPNGMDRGLTTVTLTLLLYATLPRLTTRPSGAGWDEITNIHDVPPSLQKHSHLPITETGYSHDGVQSKERTPTC